MRYEDGIILAFLLNILVKIYLMIKVNSQLNENLKKINLNINPITGKVTGKTSLSRTAIIFAHLIGIFVNSLLSWLYVALLGLEIGNHLYQYFIAPDFVKKGRFILKNVSLTRQQIMEMDSFKNFIDEENEEDLSLDLSEDIFKCLVIFDKETGNITIESYTEEAFRDEKTYVYEIKKEQGRLFMRCINLTIQTDFSGRTYKPILDNTIIQGELDEYLKNSHFPDDDRQEIIKEIEWSELKNEKVVVFWLDMMRKYKQNHK